MTERYWTVRNIPEPMIDWISAEVEEAINDSWTGSESPIPILKDSEEGLFIRFIGAAIPDKYRLPKGEEFYCVDESIEFLINDFICSEGANEARVSLLKLKKFIDRRLYELV